MENAEKRGEDEITVLQNVKKKKKKRRTRGKEASMVVVLTGLNHGL